MKILLPLRWRALVVFAVTTLLMGCSVTSSGRRFYSGEALPQKETALVLTKSNCLLGSITREGQPKMSLWSENRFLGEFLPATYALELRYIHKGDYSAESGGMVPYTLQVAAGHRYYIYAEFPAPNTWRPAVIDIANDEEYQEIAKLNNFGWLGDSDEDPEFIRKRIDKYFAGPRAMAIKEAHPVGNGVISIWR